MLSRKGLGLEFCLQAGSFYSQGQDSLYLAQQAKQSEACYLSVPLVHLVWMTVQRDFSKFIKLKLDVKNLQLWTRVFIWADLSG